MAWKVLPITSGTFGAHQAPVSQRQRKWSQTPSSVGSNPTRGTNEDGFVGGVGKAARMYASDIRQRGLGLLLAGHTLSQVSRHLGVSRSALRAWQAESQPLRGECPTCDETPLAKPSYSALLGYYLGDGCVSAARRCFTLRVSCDAGYPAIVADVQRTMLAVRPLRRVFLVRAPGVVVVQSNWKHWPCLFPQHGPGRKHERPIVLEPWQREVVDAFPGDFLRGLFHSDGARVNNWATRRVAGELKRYDYPRWMFVNSSDDIIDLCTQTLDEVGIAWRRPRLNCVAVSRAPDVRRLDGLIGLKG